MQEKKCKHSFKKGVPKQQQIDQQCDNKLRKFDQQYIKIDSKSIRSRPKSIPKSIWIDSGKRWFQNPQQYGARDDFFSLLAPGVDFGDDFGAHWIDGGPQIDHFQEKKNEKGGPKNVWKTKWGFYWCLIPKWKGLKGKHERLAEDTTRCKIAMFGVSWNLEKMVA